MTTAEEGRSGGGEEGRRRGGGVDFHVFYLYPAASNPERPGGQTLMGSKFTEGHKTCARARTVGADGGDGNTTRRKSYAAARDCDCERPLMTSELN